MSGEVTVWRIAADTREYEAQDLSGRGAEKTGGRWNHKGTPLVYASVSRALACLETVVHLGGGHALPLNRYLVQIRMGAELWDARAVLNREHVLGWDAEPAGRVSMDWGTTWVRGKTTLLAEVPSVIVPEEPNILINPGHPDVGRIIALKIRRWTYDQRLW